MGVAVHGTHRLARPTTLIITAMHWACHGQRVHRAAPQSPAAAFRSDRHSAQTVESTAMECNEDTLVLRR